MPGATSMLREERLLGFAFRDFSERAGGRLCFLVCVFLLEWGVFDA